MNLKNYTSGVSVSRTIMEIEKKLVEIGASGIMKNYEAGKIIGIAFEIAVNDVSIPIRLPVRTKEVFKHFKENKPPGISAAKYPEQAERTAWRTILQWVEIQIQMILLGQAKFEEVFMPYIWVAKKQQTLFEVNKSDVLLLTKN